MYFIFNTIKISNTYILTFLRSDKLGRKKSILLIALILFFHISTRFVSTDMKNENISKEQWIEDIKYMGSELPRKHHNLFFNIDKDEFNNEILNLIEDVPQLNSDDIQIRIMKILAKVGDSHTNLTNFKSKSVLPIKLYVFSDGIYIIAVDKEYEELLGLRLLSINHISIEDIIRQVSSIIPHENQYFVKSVISNYIEDMKILKHFKIIDDMNVIVTLLDENNNIFERNISIKDYADIDYKYLEDNISEKPLYLMNEDKRLWSRMINDRILYIKYNGHFLINNPKDINNILKHGRSNDIENIIIDIRNNSGGTFFENNGIIRAIRKIVETEGPINEIAVIIGRETFSSGVLFALSLIENFQVKLYGEPTGGKPSHYGEVRNINLPNSNLTINYSKEFFDSSNEEDSLYPDEIIEVSYYEYIQGTDPVLNKVLDNMN